MLPVIISSIENPEDRDLMSEFYLRYNILLYGEARKHLDIEEDIEDTVFEALAKIIEKIDLFRTLKPQQRVAYALTTVKNLSYILRKRESCITFISFEDVEFEIPAKNGLTTERIVENRLFKEKIKQVWKKLDLEERMLLEQKYILQWKDEDLARNFGIQSQSVRMRLTRAKRKVLKQMQELGFKAIEWEI